MTPHQIVSHYFQTLGNSIARLTEMCDLFTGRKVWYACVYVCHHNESSENANDGVGVENSFTQSKQVSERASERKKNKKSKHEQKWLEQNIIHASFFQSQHGAVVITKRLTIMRHFKWKSYCEITVNCVLRHNVIVINATDCFAVSYFDILSYYYHIQVIPFPFFPLSARRSVH